MAWSAHCLRWHGELIYPQQEIFRYLAHRRKILWKKVLWRKTIRRKYFEQIKTREAKWRKKRIAQIYRCNRWWSPPLGMGWAPITLGALHKTYAEKKEIDSQDPTTSQTLTVLFQTIREAPRKLDNSMNWKHRCDESNPLSTQCCFQIYLSKIISHSPALIAFF